MKYISFLLFFLSLAFAVSAKPIKWKGLVFATGRDNGSFCYRSYNLGKDQAASQIEAMDEYLYELSEKESNPFLWEKNAPVPVNIILPINGDLDQIHKEIEKVSSDSYHPSWIWNGIEEDDVDEIELQFNLNKDGTGWVDIVDGKDRKVGYFTCHSSDVREKPQPAEGKWSTGPKYSEKEKTGSGRMGKYSKTYGSFMPWAIKLNNPEEEIYIHGGDLKTGSKGCLRIPERGAWLLYHILPSKGFVVRINYLYS